MQVAIIVGGKASHIDAWVSRALSGGGNKGFCSLRVGHGLSPVHPPRHTFPGRRDGAAREVAARAHKGVAQGGQVGEIRD